MFSVAVLALAVRAGLSLQAGECSAVVTTLRDEAMAPHFVRLLFYLDETSTTGLPNQGLWHASTRRSGNSKCGFPPHTVDHKHYRWCCPSRGPPSSAPRAPTSPQPLIRTRSGSGFELGPESQEDPGQDPNQCPCVSLPCPQPLLPQLCEARATRNGMAGGSGD